MTEPKARVLIVGTGGVGAMAAYALEVGGKAEVTAVLRSNYDAVEEHGFIIDSIEHGHDIKGWRPTRIRKTIPNMARENMLPFDYVVVTTKNIAEVPPSAAELIAPAVTKGKTAIVLSQNGLDIEQPLIERFPANPILSSISLIGATETAHGVILHDDKDAQYISAFAHPGVAAEVGEAAARRYVAVYNGSGRLDIRYEADAQFVRWRKLVYNASFNPVAAVLRMDTARMRMSRHVVDELIRPVMLEVVAAARACGHALPDDVVERTIRVDPTDTAFKPSMCQDIEKGNYIEVETIVGAPLRAGEARGVPMPALRTLYGLLRGLQLQVMEARGRWTPHFAEDNPYR